MKTSGLIARSEAQGHVMASIDEILGRIAVTTPEQASEIPELSLDRVGAAEAAKLPGIGGAALCERRELPQAGVRASLRPGLVSLADRALCGGGGTAGEAGWYGRRH